MQQPQHTPPHLPPFYEAWQGTQLLLLQLHQATPWAGPLDRPGLRAVWGAVHHLGLRAHPSRNGGRGRGARGEQVPGCGARGAGSLDALPRGKAPGLGGIPYGLCLRSWGSWAASSLPFQEAFTSPDSPAVPTDMVQDHITPLLQGEKS